MICKKIGAVLRKNIHHQFSIFISRFPVLLIETLYFERRKKKQFDFILA